MNKNIFISLLFMVFFAYACNSTKSETESTAVKKTKIMNTNLIDGTWEANYIMNSPKAFDELYSTTKPTISFDSNQNQISGSSGCNNFNGKYKVEGNRLQINEALSLTRKMCPDMLGEQTFLETLKKVNSFSVTNDGKTLNLIMGDIAVMRLTKK